MLTKINQAQPLFDALKSRWRSVVPIAALGAVLGFLAATQVPATYTSTALLRSDDATVEAIWRSPEVLDRVIKIHPGTGELEQQRVDFIARVRWSKVRLVNSQTGIYKIEIDNRNATIAQQENAALLESWRQSTKPKPATMQMIEEDMARLRTEIGYIQLALRKIEKGLDSNNSVDTLSKLYELNYGLQEQLVSKGRSIVGISPDAIISPPTLATVPKRFWMSPLFANVLSAVVASFVASLAWIAWIAFCSSADSRRS